MSNEKSRQLKSVFGNGYLNYFGITEIIIDGGFIGRFQSDLKRRHPGEPPLFNYLTMCERIRFDAIEAASNHYPEVRVFRCFEDTRENLDKINKMAEVIRPAVMHSHAYNKVIGRPSFFSLYQAELPKRNPDDYAIFVTDDPAYPVLKSKLGKHMIVGPASWGNFQFEPAKFMSIETFRSVTDADHAYVNYEDWVPMLDEVTDQ